MNDILQVVAKGLVFCFIVAFIVTVLGINYILDIA